MIINDNLKKNIFDLKQITDMLVKYNSLTDSQMQNFLKTFEKTRYNILTEIKKYNNTTEYEYQKIKNIDDDYMADFENGILKIYIPEVMPSYKNLKTHTHKRILLNIANITQPFTNKFENQVFIFIKVFDKIPNWDIDNKYIKPIADGLIYSNVLQDDNITKMFYCVKGEISDQPHTEVYVFDSKNINDFLEKYSF
ncbi:MAG: hypothetical protein IKF38_05940 [Clostridia bacterium]|nr:hypothetical protein [Clostridia bacterium]